MKESNNTNMSSFRNIITKKVDGSGVLWFSSSNQWVYLEEPAWYVFSLLRKNLSIKNISLKCSAKYSLPEKESIRFVNEISSSLTQMGMPSRTIINQKDLSIINNELPPVELFSKHTYRIKKKNITINFDSRLSEYYIHPPLAHLEVLQSKKTDADFDVFINNEYPVLFRKDHNGYPIIFEDFNRLKRKLFIEISNIIYNKTDESWMTFIHSAGISNGKETILLSSASGSGKSTMTALLQKKGFQFVSDDFIPVDARNKRAYPFPAAISIKQGAFPVLSPFYGNLEDKNYNIYPFTHSSVRYLKPLQSVKMNFKPLPVRTIVFINFNSASPLKLTPLSLPEALKKFHEQARVTHNPEHARAFINWFVKLKCLDMQFSDNNKGINAIMNLFG